MDKQNEALFKALSEDRVGLSKLFEHPATKGIWNSIVEKYSDQAHFIYELLQNADDAGASTAKFLLEPTRLVFIHNGTRHFTITDPSQEEYYTKNGKLGDLNSITSIANSNKTQASIGKFGVGFKAVFQYTNAPSIYDSNYWFKLVDYIVPVLLDEDYPGRKKEETVFVFPFDHPARSAVEAYEDIANKLRDLSYPLLFLTNLKDIEFEFGNVLGLYEKRIENTKQFGNTLAQKICLTQNAGDVLFDDVLWLFSRKDSNGFSYSVGFFIDEEGHLKPVDEPAFCFFPTKEVTSLNFILHAPFLLTDSREGIRAGIPHNDRLIALLASLAADSILFIKELGFESSQMLIDDGILDIIPVDPSKFSNVNDRRKVSFLPFYDAIKQVFENEEIIPTSSGYVRTENAYWADFPQYPALFSDEQLGEIVENENAHWVFPSKGRYETNRTKRIERIYIDDIVRTNLTEDAIIKGRQRGYITDSDGTRVPVERIKGITKDFIEKQPISWLHDFYKWLSETKTRTDACKTIPVFLDTDGHAVAAYDDHKQHVLFLPVENVDAKGYTTVHPDLLTNENTREFIESLGVKEPSLRDQIYNIILPQYQSDEAINTDPHFMLFFRYYCECPYDEVDEYIRLIRDCAFLRYFDKEEKKNFRAAANTLYLPTDNLKEFFETKTDTRFINLEEYKELVGKEKEEKLISFLRELGIQTDVEILEVEIDFYKSKRDDLPDPYTTFANKYKRRWTEKVIDGCEELVDTIIANGDSKKSFLLWNTLLRIIETKCDNWYCSNLNSLLLGDCTYFYGKERHDEFESSDIVRLKESAWLMKSDGTFVAPSEINADELSEFYETESKFAQSLMDTLGIANEQDDEEDDSYLTDSQKEKIEFANRLIKMGIEDNEDLQEYLEYKRRKQESLLHNESNHGGNNFDDGNNVPKDTEIDDIDKLLNNASNSQEDNQHKGERLNQTTKQVLKDIVNKTVSQTEIDENLPNSEPDESEDIDQDDLLPQSIDFSKRIEKAKQKSAIEIDKIVHYEELQNRALITKKYTYGWFNTLLEMESLNSKENSGQSREVSISFSLVTKEPGTQRTLILKHPNRYIPQFIEDLSDIPLVLHIGDQVKTVPIEVASVQSYTLRVKMKSSESITGVDLSSVTSATIDAKSPAFLLEELRKEFLELRYDDGFDMQENLCENIEFIFGPPGTGKTTYLAQNIIRPLMQQHTECKMLVLTPTNKSADVLVKRIMELASPDKEYENWLIRFGATGDEEIEQSSVFRDKTFDIRKLEKSVTVTTIARFPYDYFMPNNERLFLSGMNWDYILIDEASMIPLSNIIYPLFKKTPIKFIIAGDPFQIQPISSVNLWKDENIYTMVRLNSFVNPETYPHQYKVRLLTTQYRSIPLIGDVFSHLTYGGILKHHRTNDEQRHLNADPSLGIKTLNIIKYPVSKYESIYRSKRLQQSSSYQVYSALFTFEYISYLSKSISKNNRNTDIKIGVIAPYRAQADMIDKLIASEKFPSNVDVQVGTIHGFQGDECDIIFAVFNTPPNITSSKEMFLNKQNIINVSISRAKDYLFVVMPNDDTDNIGNLQLVKRVEFLIKHSNDWSEFQSPALEKLMFGDSHYLENNAFSTSHQSVNVYGLPEKCYEIRTEDSAIDVQIHRNAVSLVFSSEAPSNPKKPDSGSLSQDTIISAPENMTIGGSDEESRSPNIEQVPKELRKNAEEIMVKGALNRKFFLVPYRGKLKNYTLKKTTAMFIPVMKSGKRKMIAVSVIDSDSLIFITSENYKFYEKELHADGCIELNQTFFG